MTKDDIITLPNPHLREKSARVHVITDEVRDLVEIMTSAALAAVQIDHLDRVVIVRSDFDDKKMREFTALINPEIVKYEGEIVTDFEGCLSVKHIYGNVPRHSKVRVKALDIDGNEIRIKAEGFLARVLQHEIDHTNGLVFIDHIRDQKDAFFTLDQKGELQPLDYDAHIAENHILWD